MWGNWAGKSSKHIPFDWTGPAWETRAGLQAVRALIREGAQKPRIRRHTGCLGLRPHTATPVRASRPSALRATIPQARGAQDQTWHGAPDGQRPQAVPTTP
jgi:LPS sulfotransferase NodH